MGAFSLPLLLALFAAGGGDFSDRALDAIEFGFQTVNGVVRQHGHSLFTEQKPDDAIDELNARSRSTELDNQFLRGVLVRVDSQFIHAEVVKPALSLLNAQGFDGPAEEFIKAFDHHRHGRDKEAVAEALKSLRKYDEGNLCCEELES